MNPIKIIKNGIIDENPTFVQVIGMCPTLAVTTSAINGVGMGLTTMAVLACSNLVIAMIRKFVPPQARIPSYIVVISSFVTIIEFLLKAYLPDLNNALGLFIPLIVVNCIILARAEAFASKNGAIASFFDGVGMGLGFTLALTVLGIIREVIGAGQFFGMSIPLDYPKTIMMILPPGAFITLGSLMALINYIRVRKSKKEAVAK